MLLGQYPAVYSRHIQSAARLLTLECGLQAAQAQAKSRGQSYLRVIFGVIHHGLDTIRTSHSG
jgi:hypothetical protein